MSDYPQLALSAEEIEELPTVADAAEGATSNLPKYKYHDGGRTVGHINGVDFVLVDELDNPQPEGTARPRRSKFRKGSMDERYGLDLSSQGWDRKTKKRYVSALKKCAKKGAKVDSPLYWEILGRYGFNQKKKGKKK